jgi:hypothetical protein
MLDATELALNIAAAPGDPAALMAYEAALFPRAQSAAAESATNLIECFRPDAPQGLLDQMNRWRSAGPV